MAMNLGDQIFKALDGGLGKGDDGTYSRGGTYHDAFV
jgi:hypothetical protein